MREAKWLIACAAFAAGEGLGALAPQGADAWPLVLIVTVFVGLFGHGYGWRGTRYAVVLLAGLCLFLHSSVASERAYRDTPWMRGQLRRQVQPNVTHAVKRDFSRRIGIGLGHDREVANLNRAILLGERSRLPRKTRQVFVDSGTMHVFAISGLHVMMVARVLLTMLAFFLVPYRWIGFAAIPLLWGYVAMIGFSPSAVRAALMASIYFLAPVFWRRPNALMAWALTFFIVYGHSPQMIADVGCALSFAVMLAIVLAGRCAQNLGSGWKMTLWLTFAAWIAGVPITAHVFGTVTPGGLLANIPLIFAAQYSVGAGLAGILASYVSEALAAHLNNFAGLFTRAMLGVAEAVSRLPGANIDLGAWSLLQCVEWYAVIALAVYLVHSVRSRHLI